MNPVTLKKSDIGKRIRHVRNMLGLKMKELSTIINVSCSYISEVESGKYRPSIDLLSGLLQNFNINVNWIVSGEGSIYNHQCEQHNLRIVIKNGNLEQELDREKIKNAVPVQVISDISLLVPGQAIKPENIVSYSLIQEESLPQNIDYTLDRLNGLVCVPVADGCLYPTVEKGGFVLIDRNDTAVKNGKIYAVFIEEEQRVTMKRVEKVGDTLIFHNERGSGGKSDPGFPKMFKINKGKKSYIRGRVILAGVRL